MGGRGFRRQWYAVTMRNQPSPPFLTEFLNLLSNSARKTLDECPRNRTHTVILSESKRSLATSCSRTATELHLLIRRREVWRARAQSAKARAVRFTL